MTDELEFVLSSISDGCIVIDKNLNIVFFNNSAIEITGWNLGFVLNKRIDSIFCELKEFFGGEEQTFYEKIKSLDGKELNMELNAIRRFLYFKTKCFDDFGYIVFNDISKSKEFDELRKDFMDSMSHELRTPISTIKAYLATLGHPKANFDKKALGEFVSIMDGEATKLSKIVETILEASKIARNGLSVVPELLNLTHIVEDALKDIIIGENYTLHVDCGNNIAILGDREQLVYSVAHLVRNAIKFSPDGGNIKITVDDSRKDNVVLCVEDEGIGIAFDYQERVFEAFFKVDIGTTKKIYGIGMGLYIVKKIVEAHGGVLWFDSVLGKGARFFMSLPKFVDENASAQK